MEEFRQKLIELIRNQRFNPILLEELEQQARHLYAIQQEIQTLGSAQWNHLVSSLEKARQDSGQWLIHAEQALLQLNALLAYKNPIS